jgi:P-type E1-E2 ATPase
VLTTYCSSVCQLISFVVWLLVEHFVRSRSAPASAVRALTYGLSVLIVSCPCAIGLAVRLVAVACNVSPSVKLTSTSALLHQVPLVVASTMRAGLREGVLFRSSSALQAAQDVDVVAFDKTGTLSSGRLSLAHAEIVVQGAEALIVSMTASSGHPISKTIAAHVATLCTEIEAGTRATSGFVSLPGSGVKAVVAGYPFLGGNARFTGATGAIRVQDLTERGLTLFTVTLGGELLATFGLADTARPEAAGLVAGLIARGKRVALLSGDHANAVERFARSIDLPLEDVRSACSPEDKAVFIAALQQSGHKVAAVGDGTNDGPALAQADLSLSVGSASDVAVAASSAVILGSDLRRSVFGALDLATHARQHMVASLAWCVVYFVAAILLASGAFVRFRIEPQWAGLGELVSILPVVAISLGLDLRWRWLRRRQT